MRVPSTGLVYNRPFDPNTHTPLVLHGYEICGKGTLGPLSHAVCECVYPKLMNFPKMVAILLGGWGPYDHDLVPHITTADVMKQWLLESGVQRYQIITQQSLGLHRFMPPRDTWEELALLQLIMEQLDSHTYCEIKFIAWDFHMPRLKKMYAYFFPNRSITAFPVTPDPFPELKKRRFVEFITRYVQTIDPHGTGWICRRNRAKRTRVYQKLPLIP